MKNRLTMWGCEDACIYHDEKDENLIAEVGLPGMKKEDITLEAGDAGFCVKAHNKKTIFDTCFRFDERVDVKKISAEFDNGLLKITAPIDRSEFHGRRITL